ncbi:MAG: hypothetical protein GY711_04350 [bacterium]|nr:hypothetical protein [bacterium]
MSCWALPFMNAKIRYLSLLAVFIARPMQLLVYFLSGLVPRRKDVWVFGSWGGRRFADNSAAFFLFCQERVGQSVRLVWISHSRAIVANLRSNGHEAHWWWSPTGMARCLRAGFHLFDCFSKDTNFWLSRGATKVNLWSGVPLKTFERDIDNQGNRYYRLFHGSRVERFLYGMMMPWHVDRPDLIIATSEETKAITYPAFGVPADSVAVTGFPRNDALFLDPSVCGSDQRCPRAVREAVAAGKTTFMYLPTFRDSARPFLDIDWSRLDAQMKALDAMFFIKFHPVEATRYSFDYPNIVQLFQDTDVYDVLPHTTALISDYSSIIFDYMLLNRPIVYYTPDLDEFVSTSRALNFDPLEIAVGPVCANSEELFAALAGIVAGTAAEPRDEAQRKAVLARLHHHSDGSASERVLSAIQDRFFRAEPGGFTSSSSAR